MLSETNHCVSTQCMHKQTQQLHKRNSRGRIKRLEIIKILNMNVFRLREETQVPGKSTHTLRERGSFGKKQQNHFHTKYEASYNLLLILVIIVLCDFIFMLFTTKKSENHLINRLKLLKYSAAATDIAEKIT